MHQIAVHIAPNCSTHSHKPLTRLMLALME